jgi:hypothetical protein
MTLHQKASERLPPAGACFVTVVQLIKVHKEQKGSIASCTAKLTYSDKEPVLRSEATSLR